jgi:hypothetical protein
MIKFKTHKVLCTTVLDPDFLVVEEGEKREKKGKKRNLWPSYTLFQLLFQLLMGDKSRKQVRPSENLFCSLHIKNIQFCALLAADQNLIHLKIYCGKQFLKMFIVNGKSHASTVRLAVRKDVFIRK